MFNASSTLFQISASRVIAIAYFFTLRSCDFSEANNERKATIIASKGIRFSIKDSSDTSHHDNEKLVDYYVSLTFFDRKNGKSMSDQPKKANATLCSILLCN